MSITCPLNRIWLQETAQSWFKSSCRYKSTTSAIKQGLRASKEADGNRGRTRDRGRITRRDVGSRSDSSAYKSSHAQRPSREGREPRIKKFTTAGERPGDQDFWNSSKVDRTSKDVDTPTGNSRGTDRRVRSPSRASTPGDRSQPLRAPRTRDDVPRSFIRGAPYEEPMPTPTRRRNSADEAAGTRNSGHDFAKPRTDVTKYAELHKVLSWLEPQLIGLRTTSDDQNGREKKHRTQDRVLDLVSTINQKMASGEWTRRNVRKALNEMPNKLHYWDKDRMTVDERKTGLWFDYESPKMALLVHGQIVQAPDRTSVRSQPKPEKMFSIDAPRASTPSNRKQRPDTEDDDTTMLSIPYTKAASTFLYGTNTVLACLKAKRRKLYKLYLSSSTSSPRHTRSDTSIEIIAKLAQKAGVSLKTNQNVKLLDKMSDGRPHNGVVLEASVLPAPPVLSLGKLADEANGIPLLLDRQSAEDAAINGTASTLPLPATQARKPLIVMLDGITDPGNVGSILRTCHFYNVSAVAVSTNTCAPLNSAILAKASSGACEAIPILALPQPSNFVYESKKAGWKVFAAVAPDEAPGADASKAVGVAKRRRGGVVKYPSTEGVAEASPVIRDPCILMLGAEGEGLRDNLKKRADCYVSIERPVSEGGDRIDVGVDSLNVSAAASVLVEAFMRRGVGGVMEKNGDMQRLESQSTAEVSGKDELAQEAV